jgi:hypothetical protein
VQASNFPSALKRGRSTISQYDRVRPARRAKQGAPLRSLPWDRGQCNAGDTKRCVIAIRIRLQIVADSVEPDIESGIRLLRMDRILAGQSKLQKGIDDIVLRLAGGENLDEYAKVKSATDDILRACDGRGDLNAKDKAAVREAVNNYLQRNVVDGLLHAKNGAQLDNRCELYDRPWAQ